MGYWEYVPIAKRYRVPIVVTGFEPLDLVLGIRMAATQLEAGRSEAENGYPRAVTLEGNRAAQALIRQVFEPCDRKWRGIGVIPQSGYKLRQEFAEEISRREQAMEREMRRLQQRVSAARE